MKPADNAPRRPARLARRAPFAALAVAMALAAVPATAFAQGAGQYEPSTPPEAPGGDPGAAGTGGAGTFGSAADDGATTDDSGVTDDSAAPAPETDTSTGSATSGTVTDTTTDGELPVTGLPVVPVAAAGLLLMLLGSLGLRRFSPRRASEHADSDDPSGTRRIFGR